MAKDKNSCANCSETSVYEVNDPGALPVLLCSVHFPEDLGMRRDLGQIKIKGKFNNNNGKGYKPLLPGETTLEEF